MRPRLFLIDGSALAYRAYFAFINNPLINSKGENTSAVFAFTNSLLKILDEEKPHYMAVIFDTPEPTFRHKAFADYKATRQKMPPDMADQLPRIKEVIQAMNIPILEVPGFEADDVMGTLAKKAEKEGLETYLVTSDKDFLQLASPLTRIYNPKRAGQEVEILDVEGVKQKLGVPPERVVDVLGLMGDKSDNVPGVPGIGQKTAAKLVNQFGSLEAVVENADNIRQENLRKGLKENAQQALLSKELVIIKTDAPIEIDLHQLKLGQMNRGRLLELFKDLEFNSLLDRIAPEEEETEVEYYTVKTQDQLEDLLLKLRQSGGFVLDIQTSDSSPLRAEILGFSFSCKSKQAYYLPAENQDKVLNRLKPILEDESIKKYGQNIKHDMLVLSRYGIELKGVNFDTMVAAYLLNPSGRQHSLDTLSVEHLNYKKTSLSELIGKGKGQKHLKEVPLEQLSRYACEEADLTFRLKEVLDPKLREAELYNLFQRVEMPLVEVLMEMERKGISLDMEMLRRMSQKLEEELNKLMEKIYQLAGEEFNINSPQQLGRILFEKLKLPKAKRTKTGYSTDVSVLEELAKVHPLPKELLEYRQLSKLKSTYIDALPKLVNPLTGRVHTSFNQTITATGRLSSSDPNLQNIPIRTEIGREIRRAFVPEDPSTQVILDADYSQIELRIMAHLSGDETLRRSFLNDEDIHRATASVVFEVPLDQVTPELRRRAKEINFGIMYGMGAYGLAMRLDITPEEAQKFINNYFIKYPKVNDFIIRTITEARRNGYVTTLLNRRRYLPEILSENRRKREFAERTAINTPIQGSAADLIKVAMINIFRRLKERGLRTKMILQVHDELIFEVPKDELEDVKSLVKSEMEGAIKLDVPIKVDIGVGPNWLEAH